ncbi:MAG: magnesium transporter CorA family protein [Nocardioidaceae bacterium]
MYRDGTLVEQGFPLADVSERLELSDTTVWIDLCDPSAEQLHVLAPRLGLHELAVEDALSRQRPKLDRYDTHLFLSCHAARVDVDAGALDEAEVDVFISQRWMMTVRKNPAFRIEPVLERWDRSPDLAVNGVGFLLYGLLDVVVDSYFDVTQTFDEFYELIGEGMFAEQQLGPVKQRQWFDMTRAMFRFHRLVVSMREVCGSLARREHSFVTEGLSPYFQDVYDHVMGVIEDLDSLREVASTILETEVSLRDHRQNQVMKQVSSWAAIIAVPTLVSGYYGMNVPYPGSGEVVGVVTSTGVMIVACIVLYHLFRRNQWL